MLLLMKVVRNNAKNKSALAQRIPHLKKYMDKRGPFTIGSILSRFMFFTSSFPVSHFLRSVYLGDWVFWSLNTLINSKDISRTIQYRIIKLYTAFTNQFRERAIKLESTRLPFLPSKILSPPFIDFKKIFTTPPIELKKSFPPPQGAFTLVNMLMIPNGSSVVIGLINQILFWRWMVPIR